VYIFIDMLIIKTNQPNTLVVTVSQNSELTNPEYLFSFTHLFSKRNVTFLPTDISTHKSRYDEFYFVEGSGYNQVNFFYDGLWNYAIYEQPNGSGNLNPALAYNKVESGQAYVFAQSATTVDSQYESYISNNEINSNFIFLPGESLPTQTPSEVTPTPTPSISLSPTPTLTNTPTPTPPFQLNPAEIGAFAWVDFTNPSNVILSGTYITEAYNNITNNFDFGIEFGVQVGQATYDPYGYLGFSGAATNGRYDLYSLDNVFSSVTPSVLFSYGFRAILSGLTSNTSIMGMLKGITGVTNSGMYGSPAIDYMEIYVDSSYPGGGELFEIQVPIGEWSTHLINVICDVLQYFIDYYRDGALIYQLPLNVPPYGIINNPRVYALSNTPFGLQDISMTEFFTFNKSLSSHEISGLFGYINNKYQINVTPTPTQTLATPTPTPTLPVGLLNLVPNSNSAISIRKLNSLYSGPCLRVRRSNDNAELDIYFDSGIIDIPTLTGFVTSNNGYVVKLYDQSGNGNNYSQTGTTNQPMIINAGNLLVDSNNIPYIVFNSGNDFMYSDDPNGYLSSGTTPYFISVVGEYFSNANTQCFVSQGAGGTTNQSVGLIVGSGVINQFWWANDLFFFADFSNKKIICQLSWDGSNRYTDLNSGAYYSDSPVGKDTQSYTTNIGYLDWSGGSFYLNGAIQEFIIWNVDNNSYLVTINDNQDKFYKVN